MAELSEVKGLWFVSARKYAFETFGTLAVDEIAASVSPECAEIICDPIASEWYREEMLQEALAAMRQVLAGGDAHRFLRMLEEATIFGVNRFISSIVGLASPAFLLRRIPVLWTRIRRGPATVVVDAGELRAEVHYSGFPYFNDENYVLLTRSALQALVILCGCSPRVRILGHGRTHLSAEVTWTSKTIPPA